MKNLVEYIEIYGEKVPDKTVCNRRMVCGIVRGDEFHQTVDGTEVDR